MRIFLLLLVLGLVGAGGYLLDQQAEPPPAPPPIVKPVRKTLTRSVVATGSVVPRKEVAIKAQVSGVVAELFVEPGDLVEEGTLIARIRVIPESLQLVNARNDLTRLGVRKKYLEAELKRNEQLMKVGQINESEVARWQQDFALVEQDIAAVKARIQIIRTGAGPGDDTAVNEVRSTVKGTVLERTVEQGDFIIETNTFNEGSSLVTVADMTDMVFTGTVDETTVGELRLGMPMALTLSALPKRRLDAELEFVAPKGVKAEGTTTFAIRGKLKPVDDVVVRAGFSATATIVLERREQVLAIDEKHLVLKQGEAFLKVQGPGDTVELRPVKLGLSNGVFTEIREGVAEDTAIIGAAAPGRSRKT